MIAVGAIICNGKTIKWQSFTLSLTLHVGSWLMGEEEDDDQPTTTQEELVNDRRQSGPLLPRTPLLTHYILMIWISKPTETTHLLVKRGLGLKQSKHPCFWTLGGNRWTQRNLCKHEDNMQTPLKIPLAQTRAWIHALLAVRCYPQNYCAAQGKKVPLLQRALIQVHLRFASDHLREELSRKFCGQKFGGLWHQWNLPCMEEEKCWVEETIPTLWGCFSVRCIG